jgi:hypothetical protein
MDGQMESALRCWQVLEMQLHTDLGPLEEWDLASLGPYSRIYISEIKALKILMYKTWCVSLKGVSNSLWNKQHWAGAAWQWEIVSFFHQQTYHKENCAMGFQRGNFNSRKSRMAEDTRWWLEGRSRQHDSVNQKFCWDSGATLGRKNHQQSKLQHPEPPTHTKILHSVLHWENRRAPALPDSPNLLGRCRPTGEQISGTWYSHSYSWEKSA